VAKSLCAVGLEHWRALNGRMHALKGMSRLDPVTTIVMLAARIAEERPRAAQLAYRIRAEAEDIRAEPVPRPITAANKDDPRARLSPVLPRTGRMADRRVLSRPMGRLMPP
jgi:hypothetical protein